MSRINRFTAFILFPFMLGLTVAGEPLFHTLFGTKWDEAIPLFRILMARGIFVVLFSLCSNYLLGLGKSKALFAAEVVKDSTIAVALLATVFCGDITALVWGQLAASVAAWAIVLLITCKATGTSLRGMNADLFPFMLVSLAMCAFCLAAGGITDIPALRLIMEIAVGIGSYMLILRMAGVPELKEALTFATGRFLRRR